MRPFDGERDVRTVPLRRPVPMTQAPPVIPDYNNRTLSVDPCAQQQQQQQQQHPRRIEVPMPDMPQPVVVTLGLTVVHAAFVEARRRSHAPHALTSHIESLVATDLIQKIGGSVSSIAVGISGRSTTVGDRTEGLSEDPVLVITLTFVNTAALEPLQRDAFVHAMHRYLSLTDAFRGLCRNLQHLLRVDAPIGLFLHMCSVDGMPVGSVGAGHAGDTSSGHPARDFSRQQQQQQQRAAPLLGNTSNEGFSIFASLPEAAAVETVDIFLPSTSPSPPPANRRLDLSGSVPPAMVASPPPPPQPAAHREREAAPPLPPPPPPLPPAHEQLAHVADNSFGFLSMDPKSPSPVVRSPLPVAPASAAPAPPHVPAHPVKLPTLVYATVVADPTPEPVARQWQQEEPTQQQQQQPQLVVPARVAGVDAWAQTDPPPRTCTASAQTSMTFDHQVPPRAVPEQIITEHASAAGVPLGDGDGPETSTLPEGSLGKMEQEWAHEERSSAAPDAARASAARFLGGSSPVNKPVQQFSPPAVAGGAANPTLQQQEPQPQPEPSSTLLSAAEPAATSRMLPPSSRPDASNSRSGAVDDGDDALLLVPRPVCPSPSTYPSRVKEPTLADDEGGAGEKATAAPSGSSGCDGGDEDRTTTTAATTTTTTPVSSMTPRASSPSQEQTASVAASPPSPASPGSSYIKAAVEVLVGSRPGMLLLMDMLGVLRDELRLDVLDMLRGHEIRLSDIVVAHGFAMPPSSSLAADQSRRAASSESTPMHAVPFVVSVRAPNRLKLVVAHVLAASLRQPSTLLCGLSEVVDSAVDGTAVWRFNKAAFSVNGVSVFPPIAEANQQKKYTVQGRRSRDGSSRASSSRPAPAESVALPMPLAAAAVAPPQAKAAAVPPPRAESPQPTPPPAKRLSKTSDISGSDGDGRDDASKMGAPLPKPRSTAGRRTVTACIALGHQITFKALKEAIKRCRAAAAPSSTKGPHKQQQPDTGSGVPPDGLAEELLRCVHFDLVEHLSSLCGEDDYINVRFLVPPPGSSSRAAVRVEASLAVQGDVAVAVARRLAQYLLSPTPLPCMAEYFCARVVPGTAVAALQPRVDVHGTFIDDEPIVSCLA